MALYGNKNKMFLQPRDRFELSNPGFQDHCSNHWANEADTLVFRTDKSNKQRRRQKRTVKRDNLTKNIKLIAGQEYEWTNELTKLRTNPAMDE